jgi:hypothetical protein
MVANFKRRVPPRIPKSKKRQEEQAAAAASHGQQNLSPRTAGAFGGLQQTMSVTVSLLCDLASLLFFQGWPCSRADSARFLPAYERRPAGWLERRLSALGSTSS